MAKKKKSKKPSLNQAYKVLTDKDLQKNQKRDLYLFGKKISEIGEELKPDEKLLGNENDFLLLDPEDFKT